MQVKWQVLEEARRASVPDSVVFLLGIELSEQGMALANVIPLRKTLAKLHPDGFKMHMGLILRMKP